MKMYILVRKSIPLGHQVNCVGHAALACYLKFKDHPDMPSWLEYSYKKVTCQVNDGEFELAKNSCEDWTIINESDLNYEPVAIAFRPREKFPDVFRTFKLFGE